MGPSQTKQSPKRGNRVGVNLDPELYERLLKACELQNHREGQLAWILIDWALPFYERERSVQGLKGTVTRRTSQRLSPELQEQLFTALEVILERGPSPIIDDVVRRLTTLAGKYGDPQEAQRGSLSRRTKSG